MKKTMILVGLLLMSVLVFSITVDGYVTDVTTGEGIEGATVKFVLADGTGTGSGGYGGNNGNSGSGGFGGFGGMGGNGSCTNVTVTTDVDGYYQINDLEAGIYDGIANKPGSYPQVRLEDLEISNDTTINFELEACIIPETIRGSRSTAANK